MSVDGKCGGDSSRKSVPKQGTPAARIPSIQESCGDGYMKKNFPNLVKLIELTSPLENNVYATKQKVEMDQGKIATNERASLQIKGRPKVDKVASCFDTGRALIIVRQNQAKRTYEDVPIFGKSNRRKEEGIRCDIKMQDEGEACNRKIEIVLNSKADTAAKCLGNRRDTIDHNVTKNSVMQDIAKRDPALDGKQRPEDSRQDSILDRNRDTLGEDKSTVLLKETQPSLLGKSVINRNGGLIETTSDPANLVSHLNNDTLQILSREVGYENNKSPCQNKGQGICDLNSKEYQGKEGMSLHKQGNFDAKNGDISQPYHLDREGLVAPLKERTPMVEDVSKKLKMAENDCGYKIKTTANFNANELFKSSKNEEVCNRTAETQNLSKYSQKSDDTSKINDISCHVASKHISENDEEVRDSCARQDLTKDDEPTLSCTQIDEKGKFSANCNSIKSHKNKKSGINNNDANCMGIEANAGITMTHNQMGVTNSEDTQMIPCLSTKCHLPDGVTDKGNCSYEIENKNGDRTEPCEAKASEKSLVQNFPMEQCYIVQEEVRLTKDAEKSCEIEKNCSINANGNTKAKRVKKRRYFGVGCKRRRSSKHN